MSISGEWDYNVGHSPSEAEQMYQEILRLNAELKDAEERGAREMAAIAASRDVANQYPDDEAAATERYMTIWREGKK